MNNKQYNSDIEQFFTIKYDDLGRRTSGNCNFCPNSVIKSSKPANYWHHLKNFHEHTLNQFKKAQNNSNNNNNNNNNSNNAENHEFSQDSCDLDADMDENLEAEASKMEESQVISNKRVRISEKTQTKLQFHSVSSSKLAKFHRLTAETFAKLGLPHSLLRNQSFRQFLHEYESLNCARELKFTGNRNHKRLILDAAAENFKEIMEILKLPGNIVTLAIDGWTGHKFGAKNTNILALCNGKSYLLWSDRNYDHTDSTDTYLFPLVRDKIQYLLQKNVAVCAITTDNATNMLNVGKELYKLPGSGPVILHLSCSAHTVQLMLQDIADLQPMASIISCALSIIDPFTGKGGKKLRIELRKSQISAEKQPLKLVLFNKTRWLSRFEAINRLIRLKNHIKWVFVHNSLNAFNFVQQDSFWTKLETVILPLLTAFKLATNMVQQDSASLLTLNQALTGIRKAVNESKIETGLEVSAQLEAEYHFKFNANEVLNVKIQQYILAKGSHYAFWAISLLTDKHLAQWESSFGDMHKDYRETVSWIANWGADLLLFFPNHFKITCQLEKSVIVSTINRQIAEFESGLASFSYKQTYLRDFTQEIPRNSINFDSKTPETREINWILFWSKQKRSAPELSTVAICLLSFGISEASAERSFSIQKLTHSSLRNRLNSELVEAEMILRFNKHVLQDNESFSEASDSD